MRLVNPELLFFLAAIPAFIAMRKRWQDQSAIASSTTAGIELFNRVAARVRWHNRLPWLRYLALALCIVALSRPQWGVEATKIDREGIAIAMVVDISSSMGAQDLMLDEKKSDRLSVVKDTFQSFVDGDGETLTGREGDTIGLVTFARYSDVRSTMTLDHGALVRLLNDVSMVSLPEEDGTAIGDGMVTGIDSLRKLEGASRVLIVLTDGSNNAGETTPMQAAAIARAIGIKIYTIGAGTRGMALMPAKKRGGGTELRPTMVFIDDEGLTEVAEHTGGRYFRATNTEALAEIYREIDRLEKGKNVETSYQDYVEVFTPLVMLAIVLLLLEILLRNTWLRTSP